MLPNKLFNDLICSNKFSALNATSNQITQLLCFSGSGLSLHTQRTPSLSKERESFIKMILILHFLGAAT